MSDDQQQPPAGNPEQPPAEPAPAEQPAAEAQPAAAPQPSAPVPGADKKILAGIMGIVFGWLGVHKFILGYQKEGIILVSCSVGGYILGFVGSFFLIGCVFFLLPMAASIIGLIEGIIYLTKSDEDFVNTYVKGQKPWF